MLAYTYTNDPGALLFVRNAADIILDTASVLKITILAVRFRKGREVIPLPLSQADADGRIVIRTREIAEGLVLDEPGLQDDVSVSSGPYIRVTYKENSSTGQETTDIPLPWIKGGYDADIPGLGSKIRDGWLTWKSARKTVPWGRDWLYAFVPAGQSWGAYAYVRFRSGRPFEGFLPLESAAGQPEDALRRTDVSFERIRCLCDDRGYDREELSGWDVFGHVGGQSIGSVRYDCEDCTAAHWRGFLYRSSLGVFESVYAKGKAVDKLMFENSVFRNGFMEKELKSKTTRQTETCTGYLESEGERDRWMEFVESSERYVLLQDGTLKPIILDGVNCDMTQNESEGMSFTWHLAKSRQGGGYDRDGGGGSSSSSADTSSGSTHDSSSDGSDNGLGPEQQDPDNPDHGHSTDITLQIPYPKNALSAEDGWIAWEEMGLDWDSMLTLEDGWMTGTGIRLTYDSDRYWSVLWWEWTEMPERPSVACLNCDGLQLYIDYGDCTLCAVRTGDVSGEGGTTVMIGSDEWEIL